jgi:alanine-synthesizing transaminase
VHIPLATLADDILIVTFDGLSKAYRVCGFRVGWMMISGAKKQARDYINGLEMLASMRLCANVPMQHAIQTSLGGYQSINELTVPGGRLYEQTQSAWKLINDIPGLSCTKPKGALYLFPKLDQKQFNIKDDQRFAMDLLMEEKILIVQGTGFNWHSPDHFRIVCLPRVDELTTAITKIGRFLQSYRQ